MSDKTTEPYGFFGLLWRLALAGTLVFGIAGITGYMLVLRLVQTPEEIAPDLLTMEVTAALDKASGDGFSVMVERREATELLEAGKVLAQRPAPGTFVRQGSTIRLTLAARP